MEDKLKEQQTIICDRVVWVREYLHRRALVDHSKKKMYASVRSSVRSFVVLVPHLSQVLISLASARYYTISNVVIQSNLSNLSTRTIHPIPLFYTCLNQLIVLLTPLTYRHHRYYQHLDAEQNRTVQVPSEVP